MLGNSRLLDKRQFLTRNQYEILYQTERTVGFWKCVVVIHLPISYNFNSYTMSIIQNKFIENLIKFDPDLEYFGYFNGRIYLLCNKYYTRLEFKNFILKTYDVDEFVSFLRKPLPSEGFFNYLFWFNKLSYLDVDVWPFTSVDQLFYEDGFYNQGSFFYSPTLDRFLF